MEEKTDLSTLAACHPNFLYILLDQNPQQILYIL